MKLSMWMIVERLQKYRPKYDIQDGGACISSIRFLPGKAEASDSQYVYLCLDTNTVFEAQSAETAVLVNGRDIIVLQSNDVNDILNDLLAVFDYYNFWEASVWEASANKSFQRIVDLGDLVLGNPMMLADIDGTVLAMSSAYVEEDINEYWIEARNTTHVPTAVLGSPMSTPDGTIASWTDEPKEYRMPNGTRTIGAFLSVGGEAVAGLGLWEYRESITPGDIWLIKILCNVLGSMMGGHKKSLPLRSSADIIEDLLAGTKIDNELLDKLEFKCGSPWQLLVISNTFHSDTAYKRSILLRLRNQAIPCVALIYGGNAVALVSQNQATALLNAILGTREKQYYLAGLSMPFSDLQNIAVRYEQTLFAFEQADGKPGVYRVEDYAFGYLLSFMGDKCKRQGLAHPALMQLRRYDEEKHSALYETLYQYLLHERSILRGAQALHIHRNSFMYRLQRIKTILDIDLDDPMIRSYLLTSFLLEDGHTN